MERLRVDAMDKPFSISKRENESTFSGSFGVGNSATFVGKGNFSETGLYLDLESFLLRNVRSPDSSVEDR